MKVQEASTTTKRLEPNLKRKTPRHIIIKGHSGHEEMAPTDM